MTPDVVICECFARDGLQHESLLVPSELKIELIEQFAAAGFRRVEATSYSNPKVVPQFADASAVMHGIERKPGITYKATCANPRAVLRALEDLSAGAGATEISLLVSASESHSHRNLARSREQQWDNVTEMVALADRKFRLAGTISVAFGCPFEGVVSPQSILKDVERFASLGVNMVMLADTTGVATPAAVKAMFGYVLRHVPEVAPIAHFHDSRGTGLVNYVAALEAGATYFDSAFGGVGGHPSKVKYGGGYTGNVSTEDWVNLLESMGVRTGIDTVAMMEISARCEAVLGRPLNSKVRLSGLNPLAILPQSDNGAHVVQAG
ncbi:MAG: hydroxymethylglutaryl-CoA lyase [Bordetella sp.]|nr:hydroxymethylglutaryl-CoA lyase [Bordetella sp.]